MPSRCVGQIPPDFLEKEFLSRNLEYYSPTLLQGTSVGTATPNWNLAENILLTCFSKGVRCLFWNLQADYRGVDYLFLPPPASGTRKLLEGFHIYSHWVLSPEHFSQSASSQPSKLIAVTNVPCLFYKCEDILSLVPSLPEGSQSFIFTLKEVDQNNRFTVTHDPELMCL